MRGPSPVVRGRPRPYCVPSRIAELPLGDALRAGRTVPTGISPGSSTHHDTTRTPSPEHNAAFTATTRSCRPMSRTGPGFTCTVSSLSVGPLGVVRIRHACRWSCGSSPRRRATRDVLQVEADGPRPSRSGPAVSEEPRSGSPTHHQRLGCCRHQHIDEHLRAAVGQAQTLFPASKYVAQRDTLRHLSAAQAWVMEAATQCAVAVCGPVAGVAPWCGVRAGSTSLRAPVQAGRLSPRTAR